MAIRFLGACSGAMTCTCGTKICLGACSAAFQGATLQLYSGGVPVDSCTTDASGCCTFADSGTYDIRSVISGAVQDFGNSTLNGTPINLSLSSGQTVVCCAGCAIPTNLTLTSGVGTIPFTFNPSLAIWQGCLQVPASGNAVSGYSTPGFVCFNCYTAATTYPVYYWGKCDPGGTAKFLVNCFWQTAFYNPTGGQGLCHSGDFADCAYLVPPSGCPSSPSCSGSNCGGSAVCQFGYQPCSTLMGGTASQTSLLSAWSSCNPFSWSGTLPNPSPYCSICSIPPGALSVSLSS